MIINLLANNGYIVLNKTLMKKVGLYEAILIGELSSEQIYWEKRNELTDGFFFSTRENLEEQTLLSSHQQRIAIENLKKAGILEVKLFGMPQKGWYRIVEDGLVKTLNGEGNFINILANNNYIVVNKNIMKILGLNEAVLLGELSAEYLYWEKNGELEENYFYSTRENIENQTMLSAYQQRQTLESLINKGIVTTKQKGMPLRTWYTINQEPLFKLVSETIEKSSSQKIEHQEVKNFHNKSSNSLTPCCEKNERHDVKNLNINNNNNKLDSLYNYIIKKKKQIPKEFKSFEKQIINVLEKYEMIYNEQMLDYMQEANIEKIKIICYSLALAVRDNVGHLLPRMNREQVISLYDECKLREQEYKGTNNEIISFTNYFYKSLKGQLLKGKCSSFFSPKNKDIESESLNSEEDEDEEER